MLSALSAAKKRTQPPLRPTDIRLILVIRDPLIHFSPFQEISFILGENGLPGVVPFGHVREKNTPVCVLVAPSGLLSRSDHTENPCNPMNL